jgi:hypothetical protein
MPGLAQAPYTKEMRGDFRRGEDAGTFQIMNLFKTDQACKGMMDLSNCSLRHAIIEYEVVVKNKTIALESSRWQGDDIITEL